MSFGFASAILLRPSMLSSSSSLLIVRRWEFWVLYLLEPRNYLAENFSAALSIRRWRSSLNEAESSLVWLFSSSMMPAC